MVTSWFSVATPGGEEVKEQITTNHHVSLFLHRMKSEGHVTEKLNKGSNV